MPQATFTSLPFLGVTLEDGQSVYCPGDTITGCVRRKIHLLSSGGTIRISLYGRARSRFKVHNPASDIPPWYNLIDGAANSQIIFDGPIHVPPGNHIGEWPFSITIPKYVDQELIAAQQEAFVPLKENTLAQHALPANYSGGSAPHWDDRLVEYFIQAELKLELHGQKGYETYYTTLPFEIMSTSPEPPFVNAKVLRHQVARSVHSRRLLPGMKSSGKMRSFFTTSSAPAFWFQLEIEAPTVIQVDHPDPIPFRVQVVPMWGKSSEAIQRSPPKAKLSSLVLRMGGPWEVKCQGREVKSISRANLGRDKTFEWRDRSIEIPCSDEHDPVDIGQAVGLRLRSHYRGGHGYVAIDTTEDEGRINHRLKWIVRIEVAGEAVEYRKEQVLSILPPSDAHTGPFTAPPLDDKRAQTWIRPPEDPDAPPSFAEVQQEDMKAKLALGKGDDEDEASSSYAAKES